MAKRIVLPSKLDTAAVGMLRDDLMAAHGEDVVLDAGGVDMTGALCLEMIMSCAALWRQEGHGFALENASPKMVDDLSRYGLTPETLLEDAA